MGTCWNCEIQITLKDERTDCDNCKEILRYWCNACKQPFDIKDKKTRKTLNECKLCGYFHCPSCGCCSWTCKKFDWEAKIYKKLLPEISQLKYPTLTKKVQEIVEFFIDAKTNVDRKSCSERNVSITYAKNRIKSLSAKFEGFRIKNENDRNAFLERLKEITDLEIGEERTVTNVRENGSYGQEYRDAFNLAVCMGEFEIMIKKDEKTNKEYSVFVRCKKERCPHFNLKDLIITECKTCKKRYPRHTKICTICPPYSKGKRKGQLRELNERLSDKDTCQMYRGNFKHV